MQTNIMDIIVNTEHWIFGVGRMGTRTSKWPWMNIEIKTAKRERNNEKYLTVTGGRVYGSSIVKFAGR